MRDPPKHNRYRRLVSKGFTPRMITALEEDIERRARLVVDTVCERGEVEFVEEIAAQVPVQMICEMIGLDDPSLWDAGVDEMLRFGSSIHNFRRTATRDTELRGVPIKEGEKVVLYYASANRDEDVFVDPHRFDVGRTPNDHVTFGGGGVHFCLGASLAKAEIRATMRQLVKRLPDLELAGEPIRLHSDFVNGIKTMPVRFTPIAPSQQED